MTYANNSSASAAEAEALAITKLQQELIMEASIYENGNGNDNEMARNYYSMGEKPADTIMKRTYDGQLLDTDAGGQKRPMFADFLTRQSLLPLILDSHNSEGEGERFQDICASITANQFYGLNCKDGGGGAVSADAFADITRPLGEAMAASESLFCVLASNAVAPVGGQPRAAVPPSSVWRVYPTVDETNYAAESHINHPNSNHFGPPHQLSVRCGNNRAFTPAAATRATTTTSTTKQKCLFKRAFSDGTAQQQQQQQQPQQSFSASTGLMQCVMPARKFKCCSIKAPLECSWGGGPRSGGDSSIITEQLGAPPKRRLLCA